MNVSTKNSTSTALAVSEGWPTGAPHRNRAPSWARALRRQGSLLALLAGFAWLLRDRLAHLDIGAILSAFAQVTPSQWVLAALATILSFAALARYDALLHRTLRTGATEREARRAGWVAIAISQVVGFGLVSGALIRWRMLPGQSLFDTSRLTAAVAASFLAGWAMVLSAALVFLPYEMPGHVGPGLRGLGAAGLLTGGALMVLALRGPALRIGRRSLHLPAPPVMGRIVLLAFLDTAAAASALWVLLPQDAAIGPLDLYPAFLIAFGIGMTSGTPAGLGPFEVTILLLLPHDDPAPLLGAILAWRTVYYGLPALAAMAVLLRSQTRKTAHTGRVTPASAATVPDFDALIAQAPQAEFGLLHQGEHRVLTCATGKSGWLLARTAHAQVALLDPFGPTPRSELLHRLRSTARADRRVSCLYKISPRIAVDARRQGWHVAPIARECVLDPTRFTLETPTRAGLRRKLRKALKAGVTCRKAPDELPMAELSRLAQAWRAARGGERGFSMGRFCPRYLARQQIVLAHVEGQLVGFASFHANGREWVLDLMRPACDAPDGTMQALILCALETARAAGITRLSLAALPPEAREIDGAARLIWSHTERAAGVAGLRQFKMGFAPRLEPRYIAAPSRAALALAAADIARAIHAPPPLPAVASPPRQTTLAAPRVACASRSS